VGFIKKNWQICRIMDMLTNLLWSFHNVHIILKQHGESHKHTQLLLSIKDKIK
jgi:hypothetical protein